MKNTSIKWGKKIILEFSYTRLQKTAVNFFHSFRKYDTIPK